MTKSEGRARRFMNEKDGSRLLAQVKAFIGGSSKWASVYDSGFWTAFARWASAGTDLALWDAKPSVWRIRFNIAKYRFSAKGKVHAEQAERVEDLRKRNDLSAFELWDIIGGTQSSAKLQANAEKAWEPGALERVAKFFDVREEYLRDGDVGMGIPVTPIGDPVDVQVVPKAFDITVNPLARKEATIKVSDEYARMAEVVRLMEKAVKEGCDLPCAQVQAMTRYVRGGLSALLANPEA